MNVATLLPNSLGMQQNDLKRQNLLERLLDAVKQCQIRFGGRKEIASDSDSRVICLCAQFEAVLQNGLRKSRGLALTAAAIKQAAGLSSKTEAELTFWFYVKEHLNHHELHRFYSLRNVTSELGRGRAWLRCALNEHSLERYLHMLLADCARLSAYYEDWAFVLDGERASMLPTMAADPLPVLPRSTSADSGLRKERRRKKKMTNIISFDDDLNVGAEDEDEAGEEVVRSLRKSAVGHVSSEEALDPPDSIFPTQNGLMVPGIASWGEMPSQNGFLPDSKSIDNEEEDIYGNGRPEPLEDHGIGEPMVVESLSSVSTWSPRQIITDIDNDSSHILIPLAPSEPFNKQAGGLVENLEFNGQKESSSPPTDHEKTRSQLQFSMESSSPPQMAPVSIVLPTPGLPESMSIAELRQAIVAMMNRKDEVTEQNMSLRSLLDGEMEHSAGLRQEVESLKKKLAELEERHEAKVQALMRENEVLKVQLKKYVGAVQMLKREGSQGNDALAIQRNCDDPPQAPQNRSVADIEELAANYERKLIEVAEMHGELIEFNERLYRSLMAKDNLIGQMRQELIDLRGPVPGDLSQTSDDPSLSDFETTQRALVNVWIPSVFLQGRAANSYHIYQVYIRILDNEWNVYRRYAEFRALHNYLRLQFPQVDTFNFPPKKAIGNKDAKFVEERRKQLQSYMRIVMNKLIQTLPKFTAQPTKETLLQLLPFCKDTPASSESGTKTARSKASSRFPRPGHSSGREARNPEPQSGDL
ncbi:sorting nexin-29-like isoform X3 [Xyrauchen texanus]|uniref:sorting nexin-29-like isoform X3 n=1 Tax=Xyrauchen texanus TaxID=154827 RepID=UPI002241F89B|nr:sorting nexin-29-like isoform X3 [Xyrauchen texanus]